MTSTRLRYPRMLPVCVAICLTAGQCFAAAGAPELPDPGKPRMTRDEQKQLGLQVAAEVYKQMPVQPDSSPETQYIQALGKRLVNTIPADRSCANTREAMRHKPMRSAQSVCGRRGSIR